jgi:hypothetical protein
MRTLLALLLLTTFSLADEVTLRGGGKFSGIVEERGDKVVVRMEHGTVTFDRDRVEKIDRSKTSVLQEYDDRLRATNLSKADDVEALLLFAEQHRLAEPAKELRERVGRLRWEAVNPTDSSQLEAYAFWARARGLASLEQVALQSSLAVRRKKIEPKDAEGLYQLGLWARSSGLSADAIVLFQQAIAASPDHEFVRRALGYQSFQGKWMTPTEVKVAMGMIEFEGDWMTPQAKEAILLARTLEKERKLLEEARRKLEDDRTRARAEYESQKAALDQRLAEIAQKTAELDRRRLEVSPLPVVQTACAAGVPGCAILSVHVHCSRPGCTLRTTHFHCAVATCTLLTYHVH